jgi:proline iminopeptidase
MDDNTREGYIPTENGRIWFRIVGTGAKKTPLLLLHGGPGASHDYFESLSALSGERPVIFYDQLGCGNSDKPDDLSVYTVENYVKELGEVRNALGLDEVHILGQSWGGGLAAAYYLRGNSKGVKSLVLSSPLLDTARWISDQKTYLSEMPEEVRESVGRAEETGNYDSKDYQDAMNYYYSVHLCRLNPWPPVLVKTFEKMSVQVYLHMWGPSEFTCTGTLKSFDLTGRLSEMDVPVLFICGEYDEAAPESMKYFQGLVDDSELLIIKDASHENHLEKEEEYIAALRKFLDAAD